jgi:hypothetical protein
MKYNVNNMVTVELTQKGSDILKKSGYTHSRSGSFTAELWLIMNIFGPHFYVGGDILFFGNVINITKS